MARADKHSLTRKKVVIYTDFLMNFDKNPHTGFLGVMQNEDSVKQSLRQLFLTNKGERFFDAEKGGDLRDLLFENLDIGLTETFKIQLTGLVEQYEPRVAIKNIDISYDDVDQNSYRGGDGRDSHTVLIKLVFSVINIQQEQVLDLSIRRVR